MGISFYTFKTMSYTIDVYRRHIAPCRSWWKYAMFVTYFPGAGRRSDRARVGLPAADDAIAEAVAGRAPTSGLQLVLLGFSKKLLVADRLATFVGRGVRAAGDVFAAARSGRR